jgi:RNA polymerase sigma-32 factor
MKSAIVTLLATTQILSRDAQIELVREAQKSNDNKALDALIRSNLPMAVKIAKKHIRNGIDIEDLLAEAVTGIIRAVESYDCDKGASFTTYSSQWMRAKCQEFVQNNCGTIRVGTRTAKKLHAGTARIRRAFGTDVSNAVIARELGLDEAEVADILPLISTRAASLSAPVGDSDGSSFGDTLSSGTISQHEAMDRTQQSEIIRELVLGFAEELNKKQRAIYEGRILAEYLGNSKTDSSSFGVTKQRVCQIEKELSKRLQKRFINAGLR